MNEEKHAFITQSFVPLIKPLNASASGKWGKMNAQQMVEHLTDFFKVSAGKIIFPLVTPIEHLSNYKEFLLSDKQFRENTKAPVEILGDEPGPIRCTGMNEAIDQLQQSIEDFVEYFRVDPAKTSRHPVFGELNFEEWVLLHYKHLQHHSRQFELI